MSARLVGRDSIVGKHEREDLLRTLHGLVVVSIGDSTLGAAKKVGSHCHGVYQLDYFRSGCGDMVISGRKYRVRPYDLFIVNPEEQHGLINTKRPVESVSIRFDLTGRQGRPGFPNHYGNLGNLSRGRRRELENFLMRACLEANRPSDESPHLARGFLIAFFGLSLQYAADLERLPDLYEELGSNHRILDYIKRHYNRQITLRDLATIAGLDPEYLCHKFSAEFGYTPMQALTKERIEAAKQLLVNTRLSIAEVSAESGYKDVCHFSKRFKEIVGLSPRGFQRRLDISSTPPGRKRRSSLNDS